MTDAQRILLFLIYIRRAERHAAVPWLSRIYLRMAERCKTPRGA